MPRGFPTLTSRTTARDMAMLARHLVTDFPGFYPYFSTPSFTFQRRVIFDHDRCWRPIRARMA